jgi:D-beta-D-heptose 7-phosphate kinase/D-beta-D-heptose 1-phosphate adenosyltransferase
LGDFPNKPLTYEAAGEVAVKIKNTFNTGVLLTLGSKGVFFLAKDSDESFYLPTQSQEVFDVSGAGDTVVAVFALALSAGLSFKESVRLSNQAAGAVIGKMGTVTVTPEDLEGVKDPKHRLLSRKDLRPVASFLKSREKKIVTVNGSFDLLHYGHLHILKQARRQGDILIVGLNSDSSVKKLKGSSRPLIQEKHRAEMLLALEYVDYVHIFNEEVPMPFLEEIRPHVHVNGSEYGHQCIEAKTVKKNGGKIHVVKKIKGFSTSALLKSILKLKGGL